MPFENVRDFIIRTLERELSSFEFKNRVEQVVHRANRGYIG